MYSCYSFLTTYDIYFKVETIEWKLKSTHQIQPCLYLGIMQKQIDKAKLSKFAIIQNWKKTIRHFRANAVFVLCWRIPTLEFYGIRQSDSPGNFCDICTAFRSSAFLYEPPSPTTVQTYSTIVRFLRKVPVKSHYFLTAHDTLLHIVAFFADGFLLALPILHLFFRRFQSCMLG